LDIQCEIPLGCTVPCRIVDIRCRKDVVDLGPAENESNITERILQQT
jgi:hypothetical protein